MKAYFTASLRGKHTYLKNYTNIVEVVEGFGYKVFADHIINDDAELVAAKQTKDETKKIYQKLLNQMKTADLVIAEISYPSVSVGHEISFALELNKPVVVLYTSGNSSILLEGSENEKLHMVEYDLDNLPALLEEAIEEAKKNSDVRFNFFVSPKILTYLDFVAQKRMIPRSVFLRDLIEREMRKDKDFKGQ